MGNMKQFQAIRAYPIEGLIAKQEFVMENIHIDYNYGQNDYALIAKTPIEENIIGKKFSPDSDKFLYFTKDCIWVAHLNMDRTSLVKSGESAKIEEILKIPNEIIDAFWYSESKHIVFITDKDINVLEVNGEGTRNIVTLYKFNARPQGLYYDKASDSLYFTDIIKGPDSKEGMRLYRLELRQKFFDQLMRRLKKEFEIDIQYERQR